MHMHQNTFTVHVIAIVGIAEIAITTGKVFTVIGAQANFTQQSVKPVIKHILISSQLKECCLSVL